MDSTTIGFLCSNLRKNEYLRLIPTLANIRLKSENKYALHENLLGFVIFHHDCPSQEADYVNSHIRLD